MQPKTATIDARCIFQRLTNSDAVARFQENGHLGTPQCNYRQGVGSLLPRVERVERADRLRNIFLHHTTLQGDKALRRQGVTPTS
jgi:hypothetical protein